MCCVPPRQQYQFLPNIQFHILAVVKNKEGKGKINDHLGSGNSAGNGKVSRKKPLKVREGGGGNILDECESLHPPEILLNFLLLFTLNKPPWYGCCSHLDECLN